MRCARLRVRLSSTRATADASRTGSQVPKYLKFKGKVKNRKLTLQQTRAFLCDVLQSKWKDPTTRGSSLDEYIYTFLVTRYGNLQVGSSGIDTLLT